MTLPSLVLSPQGSRSRYGSVEPALTNGVEVLPDGWRLIEGTTNWFADPFPTALTTAWAGIGGAERVLVPDGYAPGVAAVRYIADGERASYEGAGLYAHAAQPAPGEVWTAQAMVKAPAGLPLRTLLREGSSGIYDSRYHTATGEWQHLVQTYTIQDGTTSNFHFRIDTSAYTAYEMLVALPQIEQQPHPTPVTAGTRDPGAITLPHPQPVGDLLVRYREDGLVRSVRLHGPGHVGAHGLITWADGELVITGDGFELLGLIAWPAAASLTRFGAATPAGPVTDAGKITEAGELFFLDLGLGDPTALLAPDASHDLDGPIATTSTGPVRVIETAHGPAWQVMEATTNYLPNPRHEGAATTWVNNIGNTVRAQDPDVTIAGIPAIRLDCTLADATAKYMSTVTLDGSFAEGEVATISFETLAEGTSNGGMNYAVYAVLEGNTQQVVIGTSFLATPAGFTRVERTTPELPAGTKAVRVYFYIPTTSPVGARIWIARPQIEKKPYATPYADGSMGAGYAWTGPVNGSASTRAIGFARGPFKRSPWSIPYHGSFLMWTRYWPSAGPEGVMPFDQTAIWTADATEPVPLPRFRMGRYRDHGGSYVSNGNGIATEPAIPNKTWVTQGYRHAPFAGQGTPQGEGGVWAEIFLDGVRAHSRHSPSGYAGTDMAQFRVGYQATNYSGNVEVPGLLFYAETLSDAELARISAIPGPWSWDDRAGRLQIPLDQPPGGILVATREGATTTITRLSGPGETDTLAVRYENGLLTVLATAEAELLALVVDPELADAAAGRLLKSDVWTWNTVIGAPAGVITKEIDPGLSVIPHAVELPLAVIPGRVKHG
jgi:hypothetical protein